jgi:excinuclease ABC subunit B
VFLYADRVTDAMDKAISETQRRREIQIAYNKEHNITPQTIRKAIRTALADEMRARHVARDAIHASETEFDRTEMLARLEQEMLAAAEALEFEKAARLRDRIAELKDEEEATRPPADVEPADTRENWTYTEPKKTNRGSKSQRRSGR